MYLYWYLYLNVKYLYLKLKYSVASPEFCAGGGAQVWLRKKTENNKCIPYYPGQHYTPECALLH